MWHPATRCSRSRDGPSICTRCPSRWGFATSYRAACAGSDRTCGSRSSSWRQNSGEPIWAERFDRDLTDIFALQDAIVEAIVGIVEPELLMHEAQRAAARPQSITAWDLVRRGMWEFHHFTKASHERARDLFGRAIEIEPDNADGHIWLARSLAAVVWYNWADDPIGAGRRGTAEALTAVRLDDKNPYAHYAMTVTHVVAGKFDIAARSAGRAVALSPTFALGHLALGCVHLHRGRPDEAIEPLQHGIRLSPFDGQGFAWQTFLALALVLAKRPGEGLEDDPEGAGSAAELASRVEGPGAMCERAGPHIGSPRRERRGRGV